MILLVPSLHIAQNYTVGRSVQLDIAYLLLSCSVSALALEYVSLVHYVVQYQVLSLHEAHSSSYFSRFPKVCYIQSGIANTRSQMTKNKCVKY
jgi:hypothetical protein